jgi:hypothetical protein
MEVPAKADDDLLTEELAGEANSPENRSRDRIILRRLPAEPSPLRLVAFSGKLRHELEHARQWEACAGRRSFNSAMSRIAY